MENPTYAEAAYMVKMKRKRAKQAMSKIIENYGVYSNEPAPGLEVLVDYFSNMIYGIELLMKILARQWDGGKPKPNHDVAGMYKEIFGWEHRHPDLMAAIKEAIVDQKFLIHPKGSLLNRVPDIEALWDELSQEYDQRTFRQIDEVQKEITLDDEAVKYLRDNIERFYQSGSVLQEFRPKEVRIEMLKFEIQLRQKRIEALEQSTETLQEEQKRQEDELMKGFLNRIDSLRGTMDMKIQQSFPLSFGIFTFTVGIPGSLERG